MFYHEHPCFLTSLEIKFPRSVLDQDQFHRKIKSLQQYSQRGFYNWLKLGKLSNIKVFGVVSILYCLSLNLHGELSPARTASALPFSGDLSPSWLVTPKFDGSISIWCLPQNSNFTAFSMPKLYVWKEGAFWGTGMDIKLLSGILNGH